MSINQDPTSHPYNDLSEALARAEHARFSGSVESFEGPPPEVQREMVEAERAWNNLAAQGRAVRFGTGADGRVSVALTDSSGRPLDMIGPIGLFRLLKAAC
jgi:hypothetical protein